MRADMTPDGCSPPPPRPVALVGAGPGSPDLITVRGLRLLRAADVVAYDALIHPGLLDEIRPDAERVYVGKRGYCVGSTLQETINDVLVNRARQGLAVVRLKGGDPCVFGRGGEEAEYLAERGVPFEIVPGVTTAVGACAAANIPLTHRDAGQAVALVTGHFDPDSPDCTLDWVGLARMSNVVVYMGLRHLPRIAAKLVGAGMPADTPAAVVERATLPDMRVVDAELATLADRAADAGVTAPAVIVVGECVRFRDRLTALAAREEVCR
ncbi:MAG: uroporphyrinogen-III C-methyltransferase [Gemmataceae bacterium]|nr:uroporphyrinogen-III C-methyltransferase [Gemmataceae bacterium]